MIARLRTAAGNVPLFEQAGAAPGVPTGSLTHAVRPDLLAAAERAAAAGAGALPEPSAAHLRAVLVALARDAMPWCSPARRSGRASMRSPHTRSRPYARTRRSPTHARAPASGSPCRARRRAASGRLAHCSSGKRARRSREWRCGSCRMHGRASGRATRPAIATIAAIARVADAA
ncbi:Asp/Glu racemase [Burkholderia pseudomallei]|uniref:Asp/Glu racemase n=1 Tax=Burkholderia pseudomallei TaxID=28450 RepID=UPI000B296F36